MKRSAFQLVRGVYGRVRRWRSPRRAQQAAQARDRYAGPLSVIRRALGYQGSCRRPLLVPRLKLGGVRSEGHELDQAGGIAVCRGRKSPPYASGAAITSFPSSTANHRRAKGTNVSREGGCLSDADAAPPKPVALGATTVPDGGGRGLRRRSACASRRP